MWFMGMTQMVSQKIPATKPLIFDQRAAHVKAFRISPFLGVQRAPTLRRKDEKPLQ